MKSRLYACREDGLSRSKRNKGYILGVDIGGTFTDVAMIDVASSTRRFFKTPLTPDCDATQCLTPRP
jgi:predicted NBD/HSP70 family sugar kinase